jgi:hypothetical protein
VNVLNGSSLSARASGSSSQVGCIASSVDDVTSFRAPQKCAGNEASGDGSLKTGMWWIVQSFVDCHVFFLKHVS